MADRSPPPIPREGGFRLRGLEMTRIETFTDAAFAFAVTMLVISIDSVPTSLDELGRALRDIPAFALSFGILTVFWWGHYNWSRRFGLDDGTSVLLSLALVFLVLCYVYPLRFLFGTFAHYVTGGWASPGAAIDATGELSRIFTIYGVGYASTSGCLLALNLHAWRRREPLQLNERERAVTRLEIQSWATSALVGLLSAAVALLGPENQFGLAGWVYLSLVVILPWQAARTRARIRAVDED